MVTNALQLQYTDCMKTSIIPSVRIAPEFRAQMEQVLHEDESLSAFVEAAVRDSVQQRLNQADFVRRGMASLAQARASGSYVDADAVVERLARRLDAARKTLRERQ